MSDTPSPIVLCVDDEENILGSLRRVFRPEGYQVLTATSGEAAIAVLEKQAVDLVISDMRMPGMNGAQLLEKIADRWPDTVRVLLTGFADVASTVDAINKGRIFRYVAKPWDDQDLRLTARHALERRFLKRDKERLEVLTRQQNEELQRLNAGLEQQVRARTAEIQQTADMLDAAYEELKRSFDQAVNAFANLIGLRDSVSHGHARRVANYGERVARRLGLSDQETRDVRNAGLLHDIGKLAFPDTILTAPYTTLTPHDRKQMDRHPLIGEAALAGLAPLTDVARLIRGHHELFNGKGFPDGELGDEIPVGARILCAVNEYDALQMGTMIEGRMEEPEARAYVVNGAGTRYDPKVVEAFLAVLDDMDAAERAGLDEIRVTSADLRDGMELTRDLVTPDGTFLLSKGYRLNQVLIEKIRAFEHEHERGFTVHVRPVR